MEVASWRCFSISYTQDVAVANKGNTFWNSLREAIKTNSGSNVGSGYVLVATRVVVFMGRAEGISGMVVGYEHEGSESADLTSK